MSTRKRMSPKMEEKFGTTPYIFNSRIGMSKYAVKPKPKRKYDSKTQMLRLTPTELRGLDVLTTLGKDGKNMSRSKALRTLIIAELESIV